MVYEPIGFDWQSFFEVDFTARFNGLMLRGAEEVNIVYCSVFPTVEVLQKFIDSSREGDLLFLHHPLDMACGDPRGAWGQGFQPIQPDLLAAMRAKRLSFYACHVPLDYNEQISTSLAIARALHSRVIGGFLRHEGKDVGLIGEIKPVSTQLLIEQLKAVFDIPYVDFEGVEHSTVHKIAIVPGSGDRVAYMQEAEAKGV
jgi:putative NIF3 family GTP cyclohydrolase 1 type 2